MTDIPPAPHPLSPLLDRQSDWYWPSGDHGNGGIPGWGTNQWLEHQTSHAHFFASLVPEHKRHTVVCAGGHIGIMPVAYARAGFESVIAFEPDPENFRCLLANTVRHLNEGCTRVRAVESALGAASTRRWLRHNEENSGASNIVDVLAVDGLTLPAAPRLLKVEVTPLPRLLKVEVTPLDAFHLKALDLLQLDVEGYEWYALEGAIDSIRAHRPVIVLEMQPRFDGRYRRGSQDVLQWLHTMDYFEVKTERIDHDRVFRPLTKGFT